MNKTSIISEFKPYCLDTKALRRVNFSFIRSGKRHRKYDKKFPNSISYEILSNEKTNFL